MRKNALTNDEQRAAVQAALGHQQKMQHTIFSLQRQQASSTVRDDSLTRQLTELETGVQGLQKFFSDFLKPDFYIEKQPLDQPEGTPAAQRVLELPELLELVMDYLTIPDMLRFQQVNRSAKASIEGSPRLQTALALRPVSPDGTLRFPFAENLFAPAAGFTCNSNVMSRGSYAAAGINDPIRLTAHFTSRDGDLPKLGSRCRSM